MKKLLKTIISYPFLLITNFACVHASPKEGPKLRLQVENEYTDHPLSLSGTLPSSLKGSLVRNCVVPVYEEGKDKNHLFDGIGMLHSFQIEDGKISYSSRYIHSDAYAKVVQSDTNFYQCKLDLEKTKHIQDAAVNVFKYNDDYVALTETPFPVRFDLKTLETLGNFEFQDKLPKSGTFETAHPHYFAETKELYNFLIEFGWNTQYVLYKLEGKKREVIARIPVSKPGYMHSFAMTEKYLVLVEYPLVVNPLSLLTAKVDSFATYIKLFKWIPDQGTRFLVVEKSSGKLVSEIKSQAFFSFHHANAYDDGNEIVIDLTANNFAKMGHLFPQSEGSSETLQGLHRFRLNLDTKSLNVESALEQKTVEFPKAPDHLDGKPYRYLYMVNYNEKNSALVKYDWEQKKEISWKAENTKILEPIFVPSENAQTEDAGVILTVVTDPALKQSYLLVLDARNLTEIARAILPEALPDSFHGQFFK